MRKNIFSTIFYLKKNDKNIIQMIKNYIDNISLFDQAVSNN